MTCPQCHYPNSPIQLLCRGCQEPLRRAKLRVVAASGKEHYLDLNHQNFTIGREAHNDLVLLEDAVSRTHARLQFVAGAYRAEDLGSKNGLFVNGTQAVSQPLMALDCLQIGTTRIYYLLHEVTHSALAARLNFSASGKTLARASTSNVAAQHAKAESLFEQALHPLLQGVLHLAQAERATLWLPDSSGDLIPRLSAGTHSAANNLTVEQPIALKIFRSGGTILREREEATEIFSEGLTTAAECAYQLLGLPLRLVREVSSHERPPLGALLLHSRTPAQKLIPAKLERLKRFLAQAEVSLSRVEIVTATLRALETSAGSFAIEAVALAIQKQVLPVTIPRVAGYDLAGWFNPAEAVSGDYLDVVPLDSGEVLLVVGDVSGKGLAAAATIFALQVALHLFARYEAGLEKIVAHLNRVAHALGSAAVFTTLFLGVLDPQRRTLQYINAGHTPGLFIHSSDATPTVELLHSNAAALGVLDTFNVEPRQLLLPSASALVLFTDGLTEAVNENGEQYGLVRLTERIVADMMSARQVSAAHVLETLREDLTLYSADFRGKIRRADDQAALVVRVR